MDAKLIDNVRRILSISILRENLKEYFNNKGIDLNSVVHPPVIKDIGECVGLIANRVEVKPHMEEIDPTTNYVKIGWNLFVLGTQRMALGRTIHESLAHMEAPITNESDVETSTRLVTASEIINFITETLDKHNIDLYVSNEFSKPSIYASKVPVSAAYYERNRSVGHKIG
jgi:hypothetical protein